MIHICPDEIAAAVQALPYVPQVCHLCRRAYWALVMALVGP